MKRYEIFCGNLAWNGFGFTSGKGMPFWSKAAAEEALFNLEDHYPDAVLSVEQIDRDWKELEFYRKYQKA